MKEYTKEQKEAIIEILEKLQREWGQHIIEKAILEEEKMDFQLLPTYLKVKWLEEIGFENGRLSVVNSMQDEIDVLKGIKRPLPF